jgi:hypothetical protein
MVRFRASRSDHRGDGIRKIDEINLIIPSVTITSILAEWHSINIGVQCLKGLLHCRYDMIRTSSKSPAIATFVKIPLPQVGTWSWSVVTGEAENKKAFREATFVESKMSKKPAEAANAGGASASSFCISGTAIAGLSCGGFLSLTSANVGPVTLHLQLRQR